LTPWAKGNNRSVVTNQRCVLISSATSIYGEARESTGKHPGKTKHPIALSNIYMKLRILSQGKEQTGTRILSLSKGKDKEQELAESIHSALWNSTIPRFN